MGYDSRKRYWTHTYESVKGIFKGCMWCGDMNTAMPHERCYKLDNQKRMWSKKYKKCIECGTTKRIHACKGRCTTCSSRERYRTEPKRREQCKASAYNWMANNPERWKEIQAKAMKKYLKKKRNEKKS